MTTEEALELQRATCERLGLAALPPGPGSKVGISLMTVESGLLPLHGLRHLPTESTNGWYVWAGEDSWSDEADFFDPLHVEHLYEVDSPFTPYLALPPGWRFLVAPGHEDVWEDPPLRVE